ncbi:MAG: response regulator transcription factor [Bacteroidales bacterium]|nr:response regulator transcription factor [Bacteroidales bacterium]
MEKQFKVFLVEDDNNFGAVLKSYLEIHRYLVTWIDDGINAISEFNKEKFDICILDVMLPNIDGFEIARQLRSINQEIPLIFLTAKSLKSDILKGFKIGADDYITKPFDSEVLLCRINAILKRNKIPKNQISKDFFRIGKYTFNYILRTIYFNEKKTRISPKEAELLKLLCLHVDEILPREKALKTIWGDDNYFTTRSMDVFITKLRKYFKKDNSIEIINIHGSGYRLTCD